MSLVAAFPLGTSYLPGEAVILRVFEPRYLHLLADVRDTTNSFVTVLIEAGSEVGGGDKRFDTGVTVVIDHVAPADFGFQLFAHAEKVVDVVRWDDLLDYPRAEIAPQVLDAGHASDARQSLVDIADDIRRFVNRVRELGLASNDFSHLEATLDVPDHTATDDELWSTFWRFAGLVPSTPLDKYEFLRTGDLPQRGSRVRNSIAHLNDLLSFRYG